MMVEIPPSSKQFRNILVAVALILTSLAHDLNAETVIEKKLPELTFKVVELPTQSLKIDVSNLKVNKGVTLEAKSSYIPNPPRIVLDIQGAKIAKNQTFSVTNPAVKSVRLGVHPDYIRIVIDLLAEGALNGAVEKIGSDQFALTFSVKNTTTKSYHQPVKSEPVVTSLPTPEVIATFAATFTAAPIKNTPAKEVPTAPRDTPTPRPTVTQKIVKATATPEPSPTIAEPLEMKEPAIEENLAALPIRKVPAPPTATPLPPTAVPATATPKATQTSTPLPTQPPADLEEAPLSSLMEGKTKSSDLPSSTISSPSDPLSHEGVGFENSVDSSPIGPKNATQYLVEVRFDYQIQDHDPLLRLVMMSGANFNLVKKDSQLYQLVVPKSGIKSKVLAQPHFPPHDFVGFTLVHPRYENDSLIIDIGVDRGARISAFARGNEIWVRGLAK